MRTYDRMVSKPVSSAMMDIHTQVAKTMDKYDKIHDWHKEMELYSGSLKVLAQHPHRKIEYTHLAMIQKYIKGKRVLEVGCGVGHITKALARYAKEVYAFDLSKVVYHAAQINHRRNIHYFRADATKIPFNDNTFDVIVSSEVLEHIPEPEKVIREMYRVLVPKGKVCLSTPNLLLLFDPFEMLAGVKRPVRWFKLLFRKTDTHAIEHDRPMLPSTLRRWFTESGFVILQHKTVIFNFWRKPYLPLVKLLDRHCASAEKIIRGFIRLTDKLIESDLPVFRWIGTRQFILAEKK